MVSQPIRVDGANWLNVTSQLAEWMSTEINVLIIIAFIGSKNIKKGTMFFFNLRDPAFLQFLIQAILSELDHFRHFSMDRVYKVYQLDGVCLIRTYSTISNPPQNLQYTIYSQHLAIIYKFCPGFQLIRST